MGAGGGWVIIVAGVDDLFQEAGDDGVEGKAAVSSKEHSPDSTHSNLVGGKGARSF